VRPPKPTSYQKGLWAEAACRASLLLRGYAVIARRYRSTYGEIDLIAKRGRVLAIIEVKQRASLAQAAEVIFPRQRERLLRAATSFVAQHAEFRSCDIRFDAMLVAPWRWPRHICNAWSKDS